MEAARSSSSWPETTPRVGLNASKDYRAYVALALCALLGWALLVLTGYFSGKNHFPLNEKVAKDALTLVNFISRL